MALIKTHQKLEIFDSIGKQIKFRLSDEEIEILQTLREYRNNFSRISNLIEENEKGLHTQLRQIITDIGGHAKETEMIGKGKAVSHTKVAIHYAKEKISSVEIGRYDIVGNTPAEIASDMRFHQELNTRATNNTLSFVISPTIEDEKNISTNDLKDITISFGLLLNIPTNHTSIFTCT